jgi:hypothetical protein
VGAGLLLASLGGGGQAQTAAPPAAAADAAPRSAPAPKSVVGVSKFEARRMRHACQERANKESLKGSEREAFLTRCFFGRAVTRKLRHECRKQALAKGVDKSALRDVVRECVKEQRARQKLPE